MAAWSLGGSKFVFQTEHQLANQNSHSRKVRGIDGGCREREPPVLGSRNANAKGEVSALSYHVHMFAVPATVVGVCSAD